MVVTVLVVEAVVVADTVQSVDGVVFLLPFLWLLFSVSLPFLCRAFVVALSSRYRSFVSPLSFALVVSHKGLLIPLCFANSFLDSWSCCGLCGPIAHPALSSLLRRNVLA